jgi:Protein of unknown function (DUF433)
MNDLALAFRRILEILDRLEVPYCIVGSVASSVHGASIPELLDAYPRLTAEDVRACLAYAADTISHEAAYSLTSQ